MKVKIVNKEYSMFNSEFKVVNMNYDMVIVNKEGDKIPLRMDDVEVIPENTYENIVSECRDILKIKLDKGISIVFYTALVQCIKERVNGEINSIDVFKDEYRAVRKGIWEKKLMVVVNDAKPFEIIVIGRNYDKSFDITIRDMTLDRFVETCSNDISILKKEISQREVLVDIYKKAIKKVLDNSIQLNNNQNKYLCNAQDE